MTTLTHDAIEALKAVAEDMKRQPGLRDHGATLALALGEMTSTTERVGRLQYRTRYHDVDVSLQDLADRLPAVGSRTYDEAEARRARLSEALTSACDLDNDMVLARRVLDNLPIGDLGVDSRLDVTLVRLLSADLSPETREYIVRVEQQVRTHLANARKAARVLLMDGPNS